MTGQLAAIAPLGAKSAAVQDEPAPGQHDGIACPERGSRLRDREGKRLPCRRDNPKHLCLHGEPRVDGADGEDGSPSVAPTQRVAGVAAADAASRMQFGP